MELGVNVSLQNIKFHSLTRTRMLCTKGQPTAAQYPISRVLLYYSIVGVSKSF